VVLRDEAHPWRPAILWLLLLAPFLGYFGLYPGPNTIPAAAILSLCWLARPERRGAITPDPASAQ
jgi:hypothetical protein